MAIGQIPRRADILNITNSSHCEITTTEEHGYSTGDFVRLTDLNGAMPVPRGEDPLNNYKFKIIVTGTTSFKIEYPITGIPVDSTNYPPYVEGGFCNLIEQNYFFYGD